MQHLSFLRKPIDLTSQIDADLSSAQFNQVIQDLPKSEFSSFLFPFLLVLIPQMALGELIKALRGLHQSVKQYRTLLSDTKAIAGDIESVSGVPHPFQW